MKRIIFSFIVAVTFTNFFFAQKGQDFCNIKSSFDKVNTRVYSEDYNVSILDLIDNYKELIQSQENPRSIIIQFFFDETNKFNKTVEDFRSFLKDSLTEPTDINIIYKFQKTRGSAFINNGVDKNSIIHLNALVYSKDPSILKEIFGKGKSSRIDTTSTRLKNFTHEFVAFDKVSDDEQGYLFLYRGKQTGKGFACDPDEDIDILGTLKNIYKRKYIADCQKKSQEEEKQLTQQNLEALQKRNDSLVNVVSNLNNKINKSNLPFTIFSHVDFLSGNSSSPSSYIGESIKFRGLGISTSSGVSYFLDNKLENSIFFTSSINIGSCVYDFFRDINFEYTYNTLGYNSISNIQNYNELINSKFFTIPVGIGYQLKQKSWPVFFQFSLNGIIGFNKLTPYGGSGLINYRRYYSDLGILVKEQPQYGLEDNIQLNTKPTYSENISILYGTRIETKILYNFADSPISGFFNLGYSLVRTNTNSNGSKFISEQKNELNSILNSINNLGFTPINIGFGISYELRKKIKI